VALSSCEAEIVALSDAAKEAIHLDRFLDELGLPQKETTKLGTDNTSARDLAYNPEHHDRTKHIERCHFFIRELVEDNRLVVPYVNTADNLADFFTKPLAAKVFYRLRNEIMNVDRTPSAAALAAADRRLERLTASALLDLWIRRLFPMHALSPHCMYPRTCRFPVRGGGAHRL
jgi:hypothetical protein